jgi:hypothetical protein
MEVMVQSLTCRVFGVADSPFVAMSTEGQVITCKGMAKSFPFWMYLQF